jgi:hypothetical protein
VMGRLTREIRSGAPAGVLLMVVGGYGLMGLPLGLLGAIVAGQARDLLTPRGLLILAFPAVGIACLAVGQHVLRGSPPRPLGRPGARCSTSRGGSGIPRELPVDDRHWGRGRLRVLGEITWLGMNGFILLSAMLALE